MLSFIGMLYIANKYIVYIYIFYIYVFYAFYIYRSKISSDHMQSLWIPQHPSEVCTQLLVSPVR